MWPRYRRRWLGPWEIVIYAVLAGIYYIYTSGAGPAVLIGAGVLGGTLAILWFIRYFNTHLLLRLSLVIENPRAGRGETIRFKIKVDPSDKTAISRITAILRCVRSEQFRDEYGIPTTRSNDTAEEYQVTLTENVTFERSEIQYFNGEFLVPSDAMATDPEGDLQAHWFLIAQAHLSVPPPATVQEEVVVVRQRVAPKGTVSYSEDKLYSGDASDIFRDKTLSSRPNLEIDPQPQPSPLKNTFSQPNIPVESQSAPISRTVPNTQEKPTKTVQQYDAGKPSFTHLEIDSSPPGRTNT